MKITVILFMVDNPWEQYNAKQKRQFEQQKIFSNLEKYYTAQRIF